MAKTKDKRKGKPAPKDSTAQVEEKIVEISSEVARAAKDYRVPLIVGLVVVVGIIGLFALVRNFKARADQRLNAELFALLESDAATIENNYSKFLGRVEGDPFEPYAVGEICGWLISQGTPEKREQALKIAQGALARHADAPGLKLMVDNWVEVKNEDATFVVPGPPPMAEGTTSPETFSSGTGNLGSGSSESGNPGASNTPPPPPLDITPPTAPPVTTPTTPEASNETPNTEDGSTSAPSESTPPPVESPKTTTAPAGTGG